MMETLAELVNYLEHSIERSESDDWCALTLSVKEAEKLLHDLKQRLEVSKEMLKNRGDSDG